jgi:Flp pilus assembly protein TadD
MTKLRMGGARLGLGLLGAGLLLVAAPAGAQGIGNGFSERADDVLSRNLRSLAENPKSLHALMGAGKAALELGDPQAALTFFARAEEVAPRDGKIKVWIGAALVQLQQTRAALKFFGEASALGVPEAELARERGLAYDLAGDPRSAQRDYRLALSRGRDPETTRRLALSLAISGEREPALRLLEEQLLVGDKAAERARALILALSGDRAGADRVMRAAMPGAHAEAMGPFLARLPALSAAERALAVHLGVFPGDGRGGPPPVYAAAKTPPLPSATTDAGRPDSGQASLARRNPAPQPVSIEPRRRPGTEAFAAAVQPTAKTPAATSPAAAAKTQPERPRTSNSTSRPSESAWAWSRGATASRARPQTESPKSQTPKPAPVQTQAAKAEPARPEPVQAAAGEPERAASEPVELAAVEIASSGGTESASPGFSLTPGGPQPGAVEPASIEPSAPALAATRQAETPQPQAESAPAGSRLAGLAALIATIPEAEKPAASAPGRAGLTRTAAALKTPATPPPAVKAKKEAPEPSRHWVQVAGGADKAALPREFGRLKAKAPKLLGTRAAWTAPLNATNRLLVGPFASAKEAQAFVNQLKEAELGAFAWTSPAGQKVEKLPAK